MRLAGSGRIPFPFRHSFPMSFSVATWNINSVRLRLGLVQKYLQEAQPDVLCLQEIKCQDHQFPAEEIAETGWAHMAVRGEKAYNGVAILSKIPFAGEERLNWAGRTDSRHVAATLAVGDGIELHNFYIPAGGDEPDRDVNEKVGTSLISWMKWPLGELGARAMLFWSVT